jgi:hypothetical protein
MLFVILGCAEPTPTGTASWAVDYATVSVDRGALEGQHVWVFYGDGWQKNQDEGWHECSILQSVTGQETDPWDGCEGCLAMYEVELEDLQHDCTERLVSDPAYTGILGFGIGEVSSELEGDQPYDGALGWYIAYETGDLLVQGYAWAEGLEFGREVEEGWVDEQVYTLWPAYAWDLGE